MGLSFGGIACEDPAALYRDLTTRTPPVDCSRWWGKAGVFRVPLGREPGRGWVLLKRSSLDDLEPTADHDLVFSGSDAAHVVTLSPVTLLHRECVSPGASDDPNAVYLCEVVDRRHFLAMTPTDPAEGVGYNLVNPDGSGDYLADSLNAGGAWTWQEVVTDLATTLGIDPLTLPFSPDGVPQSLEFWAPCTAWDALNDVLDRLACRLEYDPESAGRVGTGFSVVRLGSADATFSATDTALRPDRLWDGYSNEATRGWRPEKVLVVFRRYPLPGGGTSPVYAAEVTLSATSGVEPGTVVTLTDDMAALGASGTPTNSAALATRAAERAADWLRKRSGFDARFLRVYRDFHSPSALVGNQLPEIALDDRGGPFATAAKAEPDGALERWRPRWSDVTTGLPSACTGPSWPVALKQEHCLRVSVEAQAGACDCGDSDEAYLTSSDGETWGADVSGGIDDPPATGCCPGDEMGTTGSVAFTTFTGTVDAGDFPDSSDLVQTAAGPDPDRIWQVLAFSTGTPPDEYPRVGYSLWCAAETEFRAAVTHIPSFGGGLYTAYGTLVSLDCPTDTGDGTTVVVFDFAWTGPDPGVGTFRATFTLDAP